MIVAVKSKAYRRPHPLAGQTGTGPPVAPPGWRWRVGKRVCDMYFISPCGYRIRSRLELLRYLNKLQDASTEDQFCWKVTPEVLAAGDRCLPAPNALPLLIGQPPQAQTQELQLAAATSTLVLYSPPEKQLPSGMEGPGLSNQKLSTEETKSSDDEAKPSEPKMDSPRTRNVKEGAEVSSSEFHRDTGYSVDISSGTDVWRHLLGLPDLPTIEAGPQVDSSGVHFSYPVEGGNIIAHVCHGGIPTGYFVKNQEQSSPNEDCPEEKALK